MRKLHLSEKMTFAIGGIIDKLWRRCYIGAQFQQKNIFPD
jgi:hypothetical protein